MRQLSRWMTAAFATALLTGYGGVARADNNGNNVDTNDNTGDNDDYGYDVTQPAGPMSGFGASVQIGGGVFGFSDSGTRNVMDTGGSWTARLILGTRMPLALEAAYIGTANDVNALGLDSNAVLLSNGAEAALRWNIVSTFVKPFQMGAVRVDPYLFGGIAYKHYSLVNEDFNTSSVRNSDNLGEIPAGAGVSFLFGGLALDARGEYRFAFSDNLLRGQGDTDVGANNDLNTWNVSARLGWEF